jgi:hypothetical protein
MMIWQIAGNIHLSHQLQKFDLTRRRQRRFRFVENEDTLLLATEVRRGQIDRSISP